MMQYPTMTKKAVLTYVSDLRSASPQGLAPEIQWRGSGEDDGNATDDTVADVLTAWTELDPQSIKGGNQKDAIEGSLAPILYDGIRVLPPSVLTDRGYWRYLAAVPLLEFVQWRDGEKCGWPSFGAQESGEALWDCVPFRMFDRALISDGASHGGEHNYTGAAVAGTDLWRSHILRVRIGDAPILVDAVLEQVSLGSLPTRVLRPFVKRLQRTRSNVLFELLDSDQAAQVVQEHLTRTVAELDVVGGPS